MKFLSIGNKKHADSPEAKQALAEYAWYICWRTTNEKEKIEREQGLKTWGKALGELHVPKKEIDAFVNEKRLEQSSICTQALEVVSRKIFTTLNKASGQE